MSENALSRARAGDEDAFRELVDHYRRELQLHCYRILGSVQDAEDAVQETLLAGWRGLGGFDGRASMRAWLYRIATNHCLNALRDRRRRPMEVPSMLEPPEPTGMFEPTWLEPYPDVLLEGLVDTAPGPEARYETSESVALAFVTALQYLPPRQRAALVLRDVLGYQTADVAEVLDSSEASVKGALQRARANLDERLPPGRRERVPLPGSRRERELAGRFAAALESGNTEDVVSLLTDDALLTMPPRELEYQGPEAIAAFLRHLADVHGGQWRVLATRANNQPAFGAYVPDAQGAIARSNGLIVLTLEGDAIAAIAWFHDTAVSRRFGLPQTLPNP